MRSISTIFPFRIFRSQEELFRAMIKLITHFVTLNEHELYLTLPSGYNRAESNLLAGPHHLGQVVVLVIHPLF